MFFGDIYNYDVESEEWYIFKHKIEQHMKLRKEYERYVLNFNSMINNPSIRIKNLVSKEYITSEVFSDINSFMSDNDINLIQRYKLEYDQRYIQILVGCIIKDEFNNYIILNPHYQDSYCTLTKGHVDYSRKDCYSMSEKDFLLKSMLRELKEELSFPKDTKLNPIFKGVLYCTESKRCAEHLTCIYELKLPLSIMKKITSNEKEKHSVIITSKRNLLNGGYRLDETIRKLISLKLI